MEVQTLMRTLPEMKLHFTTLLGLVGFALITQAADTLSLRDGFTQTAGGRGGKIIRVTTLDAKGVGSLGEALATKGPRVIVFEIAGVIDLAGHDLRLNEPFATVAGQTAPSPGITIIRGGVTISAHDVVFQHLRVRPGEAGRAKNSGWEVDGIGLAGASDVIVDHCSCEWSTDENLSASGPRFAGNSPDDWRQGTSHRVTFSNCLIAEGLSHSTHGKAEHSKGSLIHDNASDIALLGNLYANNVERNALFKGGTRGVMANNFISNPGKRAIHFALIHSEWGEHDWQTGKLAVVGNLMQAGADTSAALPLFTHSRGPLELFLADNQCFDAAGKPLPIRNSAAASGTNECVMLPAASVWPAHLKPLSVEKVREAVLQNAGARPWDRDATDQRIISQARNGTGRVINSERDVEGYPNVKPVRAAFVAAEWNMETMERRTSAK